jgi:ABC-type nitrate/sulfonate/bicarbonate transport system substrate-binding protein
VVSVIARQGNTITFSERLMAEIAAANPGLSLHQPLPATALAAAIAARHASGKPAPRLAMVFPFSSHNYLLRHWLVAAGIDPEHDVELTAVPPPLVAGELAEGRIDGFCAGQPWGSRAVDLRCGRIALTTADIWPNHPEKVLAVSAQRLARTPEQVASTVAALIEAGIWLQNPANIAHAADILRRRAMPDVPEAVLAQSLTDQLVVAPDEAPITTTGLQFGPEATYPHPDHAIWWLQQMQRWQHAPADISPDRIARLWRPDIWRRGAAQAGIATTTPAMPACPRETAR